MVKLSPSSLNLFKDCPKCFWLRFNKKLKRPEGIFPSLPGGMDKILKERYDRFRAKKQLPPELETTKAQLFQDTKLLNQWRIPQRGLSWEYKDHLLRGAIDDLLQKKKLIVLDFKTRGYPLKEDTHKHYQDQLDIYNLLFRKNGYETEDYSYLAFYHPTSMDDQGKAVFKADLKKMKTDPKRAERLFKRAIKTLEGGIPRADDKCGFCQWANLFS